MKKKIIILTLSANLLLTGLVSASSLTALSGTYKGQYFKFTATSRRVFNFVRVKDSKRRKMRVYRTVIFTLRANPGYSFKNAVIKFRGKKYKFKARKNSKGRFTYGEISIFNKSFYKTKVFIDFVCYDKKAKKTTGMLKGFMLAPKNIAPSTKRMKKLIIKQLLM